MVVTLRKSAMRITSQKFEISPSELIYWEDIKAMRLINEKLAIILNNGRVIELSNMHPHTIDNAFRAYERYIKEHPEGKRKI